MTNSLTLKLTMIGSLAVGSTGHAATLYVKPTGTGNCTSWASACGLLTALGQAQSGDEIWVQAGTYAPFSLVNGVKIIGGFAGTENSASQSDPKANPTIVDAGGNGQGVTGNGEGSTTVLRGFTVKNGNISGTDFKGAGIYLEESSAKVVTCIIENNQAQFFGAGAAVKGSATPEFINCIFRNNGTGVDTNATPYGGGAVFVDTGTPKFTNCLFHDNIAGEGGAVLLKWAASATFVNCTFTGNSGEFGSGGAIFDANGETTIQNSIFWNNSAKRNGPQIFNESGRTSTVNYSDVQGGYTGTNNIDADPLFIDPANDNYDIPVGSPCKDVGSNPLLPADVADLDWDTNTTEKIPFDLGGVNRKIQFTVDIGAYEAPVDTQ